MGNKKEDLDIVMSQIDNIVDLLMNKKPKVKEKYHPAPKAKEVKQFLDDTLGRTEKINSSVCVTCNATDVKFRNQVSRKEYTLSGMCQTCQDDFFETSQE
jgi:hypothetical protein